MKTWTLSLALALLVILPGHASACPNCNDVMSSNSNALLEDEDPLREARAYNRSILFMVTTPYVLLGGLGLLMWRSYRSRPLPVEGTNEAVS
ncbi:MAG: hypothetical protein JNM56_31670 [Planctomycetia bacterium]|nr:hypothetical protein [Planctomycetia bacterium]